MHRYMHIYTDMSLCPHILLLKGFLCLHIYIVSYLGPMSIYMLHKWNHSKGYNNILILVSYARSLFSLQNPSETYLV